MGPAPIHISEARHVEEQDSTCDRLDQWHRLGIAEALAKSGVNLVINGFGAADEIERLRGRLASAHGIKIIYSPADMSQAGSIESMMGLAKDELGGVDVLVNNAGIQHVAPVDEFPLDKWDVIIAINLSAAFYTTRLALPHMKQKKWDASSTLPRRTHWWLHPTSRLMSLPSTASRASPRPSRSKSLNRALR